jgi:mono/diheme cytochrome c family protein
LIGRKLAPGLALITLSFVISGCSRGAPTPPAGVLASRQAQQAGGALYAANCAICHGDNGDGRGLRQAGQDPPPANLTRPPWSEEATAGGTFLAIHNGVPGTAMPSWPILNDGQIWQLVAYIITLKAN